MSVTKEICEWLNTKAAKENLDLSTERDIFKAECDRLGSGYDAAQSELAALREELLRLEEEYDTLEHANITLKLKLADAERRGEAANDLLMRSKEWMAAADCHVLQVAIDEFSGVIGDSAERLQVTFPALMDDIRAALKPTESGASE